MNSISYKRKEVAYFKAISQVLNEEIKNTNISFVTVTRTKLSKDGSNLQVFVVFENKSKKSLETLNLPKLRGFVRSRISSAIKQRRAPTIQFKHDTTFEEAQKIENIIKKIKKNY